MAAHNPDYYGRSFDEVERDLQHGWHDDVRTRHGEWTSVRPYARAGFERASVRVRERMQGAARIAGTTPHTGSADTTGRAEFNDRLATDAPVAGNMSGAVGEPGAPEHSSGGSSPSWVRQPVDQGGFGSRIDPDATRDSRDR